MQAILSVKRSDAGGEVSNPAAKSLAASTGKAKNLGESRLCELPGK